MRMENPNPRSEFFKSHNYDPKHSPLVSKIMGILNHLTVYNSGVEVYPSYYPSY